MMYTDGSVSKSEEGTKCGAGAYHPASNTQIRIDPAGEGSTQTINRAELAGLEGALTHPDLQLPLLHILMDSACSLSQVHRSLHKPHTLRFHPHREMLLHILTILVQKAKAGQKIILRKVKAHIGVKGNERADCLARRAAAGQKVTHVSPRHTDPFASLWWPCRQDKEGSTWQQEYPLKRCCRAKQGLMGSRKAPGVYQMAWQALAEHMDPLCKSFIHAPHIPFQWRKTTIKGWHGCIYNMKHAKRMGHSHTEACPLCGRPDSVGHLLGECSGHKEITGLRIARHNDTVHSLAALLTTSTQGAIRRGCLIVDGGKEALQDEDLGCRIPDWVLPHVPEAERRLYRPDIMCIAAPEGLVPCVNGELDRGALKEYGKVYILEVGFHGDTFHLDCRNRKEAQHNKLKEALEAEGWTTLPPDPILFGHGGTTFTEVRKTLTDKYHIPKSEVQRFMAHTQRRAAQKAHQLVQTRRRLERVQQPA
jgi:ribonuclease HI